MIHNVRDAGFWILCGAIVAIMGLALAFFITKTDMREPSSLCNQKGGVLVLSADRSNSVCVKELK